jgi:hypothetical protein
VKYTRPHLLFQRVLRSSPHTIPFRSSAIAQQSHILLSPSPAQSNLAAAYEFAMNFVSLTLRQHLLCMPLLSSSVVRSSRLVITQRLPSPRGFSRGCGKARGCRCMFCPVLANRRWSWQCEQCHQNNANRQPTPAVWGLLSLFTGVRGRGILRTSPLRSSKKFTCAPRRVHI